MKRLIRVVCYVLGHNPTLSDRTIELGREWGPGHVDPTVVSIWDCRRCGRGGVMTTWQWKVDYDAQQAWRAQYET